MKKLNLFLFSALVVACLSITAQTTHTVVNTDYKGAGSLGEALENSVSGDSIVFNLTGPGPYVITMDSAYTPISKDLIIDGKTLSGFSWGGNMVIIDGNGSANGLQFIPGSDGSIISGLNIINCSGPAISLINTESMVVTYNVLGMELNSEAAGNGNGIQAVGISNSRIDSNYVSGNNLTGIQIVGSSSNVSLSQNLVGLDILAVAAVPNLFSGIEIGHSDACVLFNNIVSGNGQSGIQLSDSTTNCNILLNTIGLNINKDAALPNGGSGINMSNTYGNFIGGFSQSSNYISGNGLSGISMSSSKFDTIVSNVIGLNGAFNAALGNDASGISLTFCDSNYIANNLISGNTQSGVNSYASNANIYAGNLIGTDGTGALAIPNQQMGIMLSNSLSNTIGAPQFSNTISGNGQSGVMLTQGSKYNSLSSNIIGMNTSVSGPLGNTFNGVFIGERSDSNSVVSNIIAASGQHGLYIDTSYATYVYQNYIGVYNNIEVGNGLNGIGVGRHSDLTNIQENSIAYNGDAINLNVSQNVLIYGNVVYCNDFGIRLYESNNNITTPEIDNDLSSDTMVVGVTDINLANIIIDLYYVASNCDDCAIEGGQGAQYLGWVTANAAGEWSAYFGSSDPFPLEADVVAMARDDLWNCSQFSACTDIITEIELADDVKFTIYPNPASEIIMVENSGLNEAYELQLYDLSGKMVFANEYNQNNVSIDIQTLPSGMYLMKMISKSKSFTKQIIVE